MSIPVRDLDDGFWDVVTPAPFPKHVSRFENRRWAARVGLEGIDFEKHFARFEPLPQNLEQPLALRYHGHQFDVYNPALGDGRGFLFGQVQDDQGRWLDLGTKGSGTTPYSRGGDGRLTLKGGVREVLATEMLEALGVSTSKSLSLFETGEQLYRGDEPSPTRSSVLVRLSHSHVRFGTFQRLFYLGDAERLARLVDYCCRWLIPEADDAVSLLRAVTKRSAELCASWMVAGFVHGVLNSDNMVVTGESFDYGPYRFLPHYDPDFTAAYFDHTGLYAFARQPRAVLATLMRLASSLAPLASEEERRSAIVGFMDAFRRARVEGLLDRLGVSALEPDADAAFAEAVWDFLAESRMSYDQFFFDWFCASAPRAMKSPDAEYYRRRAFEPVARGLEARTPLSPERLAHAYFERARPVRLEIDEIERIWDDIAERDDWSAFDATVQAVRRAHGARRHICPDAGES